MEVADQDRRAETYRYFLPIVARWSDNDMYGHVNNAASYQLFDTAVNRYLIHRCALRPFIDAADDSSSSASPIGLVVHSSATYYAPTSFPSTLLVGLKVARLGSSSVTYVLGLWELDGRREAPGTANGDGDDEGALVGGGDGDGGEEEDWPPPPRPRLPSPASLPPASVVGTFTHVFVHRSSRRPVKRMPEPLRKGLENLLVNVDSPGRGKEGGRAKSKL